MATVNVANAYTTTLTSGITSGATTCSVDAAPPSDLVAPFKARLVAEGANTDEIVTVTGISGTTLTILRATEKWNGVQTASAHGANAILEHNFTAKTLLDVVEVIPPISTARINKLDATFGDHFTGSSLDAKWSRHNQTSGEETYQMTPGGSILRVTYSTATGPRYIYQTAPGGDWTFETCIQAWQAVGSTQMFALLCVDSSGAGPATFLYDNAAGLYLGLLASHTYSSAISTLAYPVSEHRAGQRTWLKLRKSSTTYFASFSFNGHTYSPETSGTSAITPARIGVGRVLGTDASDVLDIDWFDKTA
jgi:hypothetical protein